MSQLENASNSVASAFQVQTRVIMALILREVHTIYGNTRLGYLWALLQLAFNILIFWGIRIILQARAPYGMSILVFLLCGFIPWYIFQDTVSRCISAVSGNQALLTFPQVTELDLMIARTIVVWASQLICGIIMLLIGYMCGEKYQLYRPDSLFATILFAPILGLGIGLVCASLARLFKTFEKLIHWLMRILFFVSGIFFSPAIFPSRIKELLMYNPLMQMIEWQRYGFASTKISFNYDIKYIWGWSFGSLVFGLLLERYVRGRAID